MAGTVPQSATRRNGALFLFGSLTAWLVTTRRQAHERVKQLEAEREELIRALHEQTRKDPLTELPNRRWLDEELPRELARASRAGVDLCAAMIDLDHFKQFNDDHGHPAGDRLLHASAEQWRSALRASDFLARHGGEEFVVLLPDCSLSDARAVIERLRAATPLGETCSAGVACWDREEPAESLTARADAALYQAKADGRDRTVVADTPADVAG
jgi:diguanylate cyclase